MKAGPGNERVQFAYANALIASGNRDDETMATDLPCARASDRTEAGIQGGRLQLAYTRLATGTTPGRENC